MSSQSRTGEALAVRTREWAEKTTAANAEPDTVLLSSGERVDVIEIGPMAFNNDRELWERQTTESDKHWEMFTLYRDQDQWSRTKRKVGVLLGLAPGNGTPPVIRDPATFNRWDERVGAYDAHCDKRMREELFQRKLAARIKTAEVGRRMREKALAALDVLNAVVYVNIKDPLTGEVTREQRSAIKPSDITRLADVGVKLERLALGEDDSIASPYGSQINLTQINLQTGMTDEELLDSARKIITAGTGDLITVGADGCSDLDGAELLHS